MRDSDNKKRNLIIIGLCAIVMIMAVGFAMFSQQLQINSTSEVIGDWCIGFDNTKTNTYVASAGIQTGTTPTGSMTYSGSTCGSKSQYGVTLASIFKQPGDSIEYTLTILNEGSLNAAIKSILVDNTSVTSDQTITKGNIKYKIEMPLSTSVAAGGSTTMKVTASFQNDVDITRSFGGDSATIEVKVNAEQDDGNGGFVVPSGPYTGTIYRNNNLYAENNVTSIASWDETVGEEKWCEVGLLFGDAYNSCEDDDWYFDSQNECEDYVAFNISNGDSQPGDLTCESIIVNVGDYTKSQAEIQGDYVYYLKHTVVNDIITESYSCFVLNNTEYCLEPSSDGSTYIANKNYLGTLRDSGAITCTNFDNSSVHCSGGNVEYIYADSSCNVFTSVGVIGCNANADGSSSCEAGQS